MTLIAAASGLSLTLEHGVRQKHLIYSAIFTANITDQVFVIIVGLWRSDT